MLSAISEQGVVGLPEENQRWRSRQQERRELHSDAGVTRTLHRVPPAVFVGTCARAGAAHREVGVGDQVAHLTEHVSHAALGLFIGWGTTGRKTELVDRSLQVGLPSAQQPVLGGGLRMQ